MPWFFIVGVAVSFLSHLVPFPFLYEAFAPQQLFRPHAGWRGDSMYAGAKRAGYRIVGWGWGLWDWNWYDTPESTALAARLPAALLRATSSSCTTAIT